MSTELHYKQLFNKKNLKARTIEIKEFQQPFLVMAIETDDILKQVLTVFYNIAYQVHLVEFKKFLVKKGVSTRKIIDRKIKVLQLIGAIEINEYYAKMTGQGVSYFKDEYYRPNIKILEKQKLKEMTLAKESVYADKKIEKISTDVYRGSNTKYVIVSNHLDTKEKYLSKIKDTINFIKNEFCDVGAKLLLQRKSRNQSLIGKASFVIVIDRNLFNKYSSELLEISRNQVISYNYRADVDGEIKLIINYKLI